MKTNPSITIVGMGNLGKSLLNNFLDIGLDVKQIVSTQTREFPNHILHLNSLNEVKEGTDMTFFAIPDNALSQLPITESIKGSLCLHVSGKAGRDQLRHLSSRYGYFYPLQSFRKEEQTQLEDLPLFYYANSKEDENLLLSLIEQVKATPHVCDDTQKEFLHLAAVYANNFMNFMGVMAFDTLEKSNLNKSVLYPLMTKTFDRILRDDPKLFQTGPAMRNDSKTIENHMDLMENKKEKEFYKLISQLIQDKFLKRD